MNREIQPAEQTLVAVVEDDPTTRRVLRMWLERDGFLVQEFSSGGQAVEHVNPATAVVCLDLGLGDIAGVEVLRHLRASNPRCCVIVTTANTEVPTVVEAMKAGAFDYLTKPIDGKRLIETVQQALSHRAMLASPRATGEQIDRRIADELCAQGPAMREVVRHVQRVLDNNVTVFLQGENGTGKEYLANLIHRYSEQNKGPFVSVNCSAMPASLQETEFFGQERPGGTHLPGKIEQANGGTLFLDEVGELSPATQAALLRVLQDRTMVRVGGTSEITVSTRIIGATSGELIERVRSGHFREDLYYRMMVYPIRLPPLRERTEDIPGLVGSILRDMPTANQRGIYRLSVDALEAIRRHDWPGNIRELTNTLQRASLACLQSEIDLHHLPREIQEALLTPLPPAPPPPSNRQPLRSLRELEREAIRNAISAANGNISAAAKILGVSRATLYRRINEERLERTEDQPPSSSGKKPSP